MAAGPCAAIPKEEQFELNLTKPDRTKFHLERTKEVVYNHVFRGNGKTMHRGKRRGPLDLINARSR